MNPAVVFPDVERIVVDHLAAELAPHEPAVGVGLQLPAGWTPASPPFLVVATDGTFRAGLVVQEAVIRLVAWSRSRTEAKRIANVALGVLCAYPGGDELSSVRPLTGVLPAQDPEHGDAALAAVTARAALRSSLLPPPTS